MAKKRSTAKEIGAKIGAEIDKAIEKDGGCETKHVHHHGGAGNAVYGLGFIGAAIFYIQHATSFWAGCVGILKAIVWPAFLIYKALGMMGM